MAAWVVTAERDPVLKPIARNFRLSAGDAFNLPFKLVQSDATPTVVPVDITTALIVFRAWPRGCATLSVDKNVGNGITITTPLSGLFSVEFDESDTVSSQPGTYDWQLRVNLIGQPVVFVGGSFTLAPLVGELQPGGNLLLDSDTLVL